MGRAVLKALLAAVILLIIGVLAAVLFIFTPPGKAYLKDRAQTALASQFGGTAKIGALRGRLPGHIILDDVVLSEAGEIWARIDRAEMRWRPFQLISGDIEIEFFAIDGGAIFHGPPAEEKDTSEPFAINLPEKLPALRIAEMRIINLQSHLGGVSARLDGVGSVTMEQRSISARVNLTSADDADTIDIAIDIAPDAERIFINATIASQQNGVIASFADLGGPLFIDINADSPPDNATIAVNGVIGAYGSIEANLLANLTNAVSLAANGIYTAGGALSDIPEFAEPVVFQIVLQDRERGGHVTINQLETAAGALSGDVEWAGLRQNDNHVTADLHITMADDYRPELQSYLGREITLAVSSRRRPNDYFADISAQGAGFKADATDVVTDLKKKFAGALTISLAPREETLDQPMQLATLFAVDLNDKASLRAFDVTLGDSFRAEGDADYRFSDETLRVESDVEASPPFVTKLSPSLNPAGPIVARIDAAGAIDKFSLDATVGTPDIAIGENSAPAFTTDIALAGLPKLPSGEITAKARNGAGAFSATLRSSQNGRIAAPALSYVGAGFSLNGAGAYNPDAQRGEIDIVYKGGANAEPWPGLNIAGSFSAKGNFARADRQTDLTILSEALRVNSATIDGLVLRAVGPPDAIAASIAAERLAFSPNNPATGVTFAAIVNARDALRIRLTELTAAIADNDARLLEPGVLTIDDGVTVDNLRLGWSRNGRIAFDGSFSQSRWRGALDLSDVNIPQTDGRASLNLIIDTDADEPASGAFSLTSLISSEETTISGRLIWNGEQAIFLSAPDKDALDMRLAAPLKLTRTPQLQVSTEGALDGYVRYDGPVDPFAAFMPPELQTLEGFLAINFTVAGTMENPSLSGVSEITDGAYTELRSGLSIAGLHARADADVSPNGSHISFTGGAHGGSQTGDDTITLSGAMTLADISRLDLEIDLSNAALSAHPIKTVRADGKVTIAGALNAVKATGEITLHELDAEIITPETTGLVPIDVINIDNVDELAAADVASKPSALAYDIDIVADDRIFIRGRGLDSEWSANINVASVKNQPVIIGVMRLRRGAIDFSGRRFEITQGRVSFDRLSPNNPLLDIRAEFETSEGVTATIDISGRADEPAIELNSTPNLPDEDIMALVLFGKSAGELTAFESLQTAQALASLGGIGPFGGTGVTGSIRRATGLDLLNFDIDPESGGGSLTIGKYVADGLFVSATQDAQGKEGAVIVEYEITDNISVETEVRQDGDQTVSANWKKDF